MTRPRHISAQVFWGTVANTYPTFCMLDLILQFLFSIIQGRQVLNNSLLQLKVLPGHKVISFRSERSDKHLKGRAGAMHELPLLLRRLWGNHCVHPYSEHWTTIWWPGAWKVCVCVWAGPPVSSSPAVFRLLMTFWCSSNSLSWGHYFSNLLHCFFFSFTSSIGRAEVSPNSAAAYTWYT